MHVIAKAALIAFWRRHPDAQSPLTSWYNTMESQHYLDFNGLRGTFGSADYVDGVVVFNIGGNKYRLVAAIHYNRRKVYVREVFTHAAYETWSKRRLQH